MSLSFPKLNTNFARFLIFLGIHLSTILFFPNSLFSQFPWGLYASLWCSIFALAAVNKLLHSLIVQVSGLAFFLFLYSLELKFHILDVPLFFAFHLGTFISVSILAYMRSERDSLNRQAQRSQKMLWNLEGEKLDEVTRMLSTAKPAYFDELTILFSDIRNFTGLSEVLPADKLYATLNAYYSGVVKIVREHGGIIDKFLGDGIMVVFGLRQKQDQAPAMAVRCAIQLQEYQKSGFRADLPGDHLISAGIGIATGRVMVGLVGSSDRFEWTCLGDPVNLAARLEHMTRTLPSTILVSETTWMHIRENSEFFSRVAGYFKVRGRFSEEAVVEIFNGDSPELAEAKKLYQNKFEEALRMQRMGYSKSSSNVFQEISDQCPEDRIAKIYAMAEAQEPST